MGSSEQRAIEVTAEMEDLRSDLANTKNILNAQMEKYEKLDLLKRGLKKEKRILEKFLRIEMRSP